MHTSVSDRKNSYRKILSSFMYLTFIIAFYLTILFKDDYNKKDSIVIISFLAIGLISLNMFIKEIYHHPFSITMLMWVFNFMFFGIAGFLQYLNNGIMYFSIIPKNEILYINFAIIVWMSFFYLGNKTFKYNVNSKSIIQKLIVKNIVINYKTIILFTLISLAITLNFLTTSGFSAILSRASNNLLDQEVSLANASLSQAFNRNFVLYSLALTIVFYINNKRGLLFLIFQIAFMLIINSPFASGRFYIATAYLGLMLLYFPKFKTNRRFMIIFLLGFVVLFPMINIFRNTSIEDVTIQVLSDTIKNIKSNYLYGDYDAYSMIVYSNRYIRDFGITFGYQLLGPIFFFIPRLFWANKPIGSGALILDTYGHAFTNGSAPLIAEGLINFGLFGVILFAIFFGRIAAYIDYHYWSQDLNSKPSIIKIFYPFSMFLFFFMSRGDLMNTFAFFASHLVIFLFVVFINNFMNKIRI